MARLRDAAADFRALIVATSDAMGVPLAFVEKDYWVTELLRSVAAPVPGRDGRPEPVAAIFKGGTSLSKAHALIARFSEDVDILLDAPTLGGSARDRVMKEIGRRAGADLDLSVTEREKDRGVKRNFEFEYPRVHVADVISSRVRLEMGYRGGPSPNQVMDVTSYIARHAALRFDAGPETFDEFAVVRVAVLAPVRTLVEKLMCLHTAAGRAESGDVVELCRGVRHYYDIRQLLSADAVTAEIAGYPGGVAALSADVHAQSEAAGFASTQRPSGGFAKSAAFQTDAAWMSEVRQTYALTMGQLVWGRCPTFTECLDAIDAHRALL